MRVGIIVSSWELVTASRGARDHLERVDSSKGTVEDAADSDEPGCTGAVELAQMNYAAALMAVPVTMSGEAPGTHYEDVADAGNAWLSVIERTDYEFLPEYDPNA